MLSRGPPYHSLDPLILFSTVRIMDTECQTLLAQSHQTRAEARASRERAHAVIVAAREVRLSGEGQPPEHPVQSNIASGTERPEHC